MSGLAPIGRISIYQWIEDFDLRCVDSQAVELAETWDLTKGDALLITNRYLGTTREKFRLVVCDANGVIWVLKPPKQGGLESLFVKLHAYIGRMS